MFPGDSEIDELFKIFGKLGTPTPDVWPAFATMPDYQPSFPAFKAQSWRAIAPNFDADGLDLLSRMLVYDPAKRISCADALQHRYFASLHNAGASPVVGGSIPGSV